MHLFSFSKSLFPGARVGAVSARGRLREALLALKQASDLSDALPLQAALAEFVASGEYDRHLGRLRRVLRRAATRCSKRSPSSMPEGSRWTRPRAATRCGSSCPARSTRATCSPTRSLRGVLFAPGSQFFRDGRPSNGLRLSFAIADEDALRLGVERLARVVRERTRANGETAAARVPRLRNPSEGGRAA